MKKPLLLSVLALFAGAMQAQVVSVDNFDRLEVRYETPRLTTHTLPFNGDKATVLDLDGYISGGLYGSPAIPVRTDVITVPFCQSISVEVTDAVYDTIQLSTLYPLQPSRSKSQLEEPEPVVDAQRYATNEFWGLPTARVEVEGIARDRRLATLAFSPVRVNPVTGQAIVCRRATVTVNYNGADVQGTLDHYRRYHSPAFTTGQSLNSLFTAKDASTTAPLRMTIVAPGSLRCQSLSTFADWKRRQGLLVDLVYMDEQGLSNNTAIANYLQGLYDSASAEAPAPTFLLLVGDHTRLAAFDTRMSSSSWWESYDHISDLYFTTWTSGDNLPDCYSGRFSTLDTVVLGRIISKTLLYEQYGFADDSYLSNGVLISGIDQGYSGDNAYQYCDPTMDHLAAFYINADNGFSNVTYYKNNTTYSPDGVTVTGSSGGNSVPNTLRNLYNQGVGWVNYSAHGDWDRWHQPSFTVSHVNAMDNKGKPSIMIGNCCLSNKFDENVCFGEALLRKDNNGGAVAYFGATNSTYWAEDFFWSIGVRSNIYNTMNVSYSANNLGMYDRLFHTHGEAQSAYAVTAGSMIVSGNMAVNSATNSQLSLSSAKLYYWEIYELMGDPSLLPWLGTADDLSAHAVRYTDIMEVSAPAYAYVAVVDTGNNALLAAAFADANGHAVLPVALSQDLGSACLSVTAQGYKPYLKGFNDMPVGISSASQSGISVSPNPATDRCSVSADGLQRVELLDLMGRQLASLAATDGTCQLDLLSCQAGIYLLRLHTASGVSIQKLVISK
ncbi:MAG: T9SS type A sorting domain-containing protein [Bacteroidales bacterium]|nr:T9SS type A sorting domain-containing protein [Bacteroidales bacterium]